MTVAEPTPSLHRRLREATGDAHERLDGMMAHGIADVAQYRDYLSGMHAFVCAVVPAVRRRADALAWRLPDWRSAIERDMAHAGAAALEAEGCPEPADEAALGMLYVVEGSSLGARVLSRQACALGFDADRGAGFLQLHAAGPTPGPRWRRFLDLLENAGQDADHGAVCAGALGAFGLAERSFRRASGIAS